MTLSALWLTPAQEDGARLSAHIKSLATRFDVSDFAPHMTLLAGPVEPEVLAEFARKISPQTWTLLVEEVVYEDHFARTLILKLSSSTALEALSARGQHETGLTYTFDPHVSLLYLPPGIISEKEKRAAMGAMDIERITFDGAAVVSTEGRWEDGPASWDVTCISER